MRTRCAFAAMLAAFATLAITPGVHAATSPALEGVPRVDHVVVLVLENESFSTTWAASSPAKYLNGLRAQGAFVPNYYATGHVSLDNYIAMTSGLAGPQVLPTYADCLGINLWTCTQTVSTAANGGSIADQVESAGLTWKQYSDGTTAPCVHADYASTSAGQDPYQGNGKTPTTAGAGPDYADRHVPFLYYSNVIGDSARCARHLRPFTDLSADIAAGTLPSYSFVTPDTCNDGHDAPCAAGRPGGLTTADAFLTAHVPALLTWLRAHNGVLLVTFDEAANTDTSGCCTGGPAGTSGFGGQVGMLVLGAPVATGTTASKYDHASLLRTSEDLLGISTHIGNAATASPITGIWAPAAAATATPGGSTAGGVSPATTGATPAALPDTAAPSPSGAVLLLALLLALPVGRRLRR
jgi:hypothetical protein